MYSLMAGVTHSNNSTLHAQFSSSCECHVKGQRFSFNVLSV